MGTDGGREMGDNSGTLRDVGRDAVRAGDAVAPAARGCGVFRGSGAAGVVRFRCWVGVSGFVRVVATVNRTLRRLAGCYGIVNT